MKVQLRCTADSTRRVWKLSFRKFLAEYVMKFTKFFIVQCKKNGSLVRDLFWGTRSREKH